MIWRYALMGVQKINPVTKAAAIKNNSNHEDPSKANKHKDPKDNKKFEDWLKDIKSGRRQNSFAEDALICIGKISNVLYEMSQEDDVLDGTNIDIGDDTPSPTNINNDDIMNELNQLFTPILVMQGFENNVSDQIQEALHESASVLMEKNIIQFDSPTKMSQLIAVCALLIQKHKNTEKYQMYKQAAQTAKRTKLEIQKEEYADAQALAQKYLVKVSTTNPSSVARQAANELLPETQH